MWDCRFVVGEMVKPDWVVVMAERRGGREMGVGWRGEGERPWTTVGETMAMFVEVDAANTSLGGVSIVWEGGESKEHTALEVAWSAVGGKDFNAWISNTSSNIFGSV